MIPEQKNLKKEDGKNANRALVISETVANHVFCGLLLPDLNYYFFLEKLPQWAFRCVQCFFAVLLTSSQRELGSTVHKHNIIVASAQGCILANTILCEHQNTLCWPITSQTLKMMLSLASLSSEWPKMHCLWERDCALSARLIGLRFIWYSCTLIPSIVLYVWFVPRVALQFVFRFLTPLYSDSFRFSSHDHITAYDTWFPDFTMKWSSRFKRQEDYLSHSWARFIGSNSLSNKLITLPTYFLASALCVRSYTLFAPFVGCRGS